MMMLLRRFGRKAWQVFRQGDIVLMCLCLAASIFGCVVIASATAHTGSMRYLVIQIGAIVIGLISYVAVSAVNLDFVSEHRMVLVMFNLFMLALLIPFGTDFNSGNRSWLAIPGVPVSIQPAEICKISFVLIMASVMAAHQNKVSSLRSVFKMLFQVGLLVGANMALSKDAGVSLIFVFIFVGMAFTGGINWFWISLAMALVALGAPIIWNMLSDYQQSRIMVLFDSSIDPMGIDERYQMKRSLLSLTGGGLTGQGLFNGNRTQIGALPAQHTDYIFSAIGEEMGFMGCILVLVLLVAIIVRCFITGSRSQNYLRRMVCYGAAMALIFQVCSNVGMCVGITPVIGLTLPFISYGGSSIVSLYAMLGLVSGVHARPAPKKHELYVRYHR